MNMPLSYRQWGAFFSAISVAVLAVVYISQYGYGMHPCHLCLLQRIPYGVAVIFGLMTLVWSNKPKSARVVLFLLALTFVVSFGMALFHWGVENKWWTYNSGCTGADLNKKGASVDDYLAALKAAPMTRCDQAATFLLGMSMAFYNMLVSAGLSVTALYTAIHRSRPE